MHYDPHRARVKTGSQPPVHDPHTRGSRTVTHLGSFPHAWLAWVPPPCHLALGPEHPQKEARMKASARPTFTQKDESGSKKPAGSSRPPLEGCPSRAWMQRDACLCCLCVGTPALLSGTGGRQNKRPWRPQAQSAGANCRVGTARGQDIHAACALLGKTQHHHHHVPPQSPSKRTLVSSGHLAPKDPPQRV